MVVIFFMHVLTSYMSCKTLSALVRLFLLKYEYFWQVLEETMHTFLAYVIRKINFTNSQILKIGPNQILEPWVTYEYWKIM